MDEITYPVRIKFHGKPPDIAQKIRQTETWRFWRELNELYARTRMRGASPVFRELVLDELHNGLEGRLQGLLYDVVQIEGQALIKTTFDEDYVSNRFSNLEWEVPSDSTDVAVSFQPDDGTYIEALTLDGSWVQLSRWCCVEPVIDGQLKRLRAEITVLVDLNSADSLFRQPNWFHKNYIGQLEFKLEYSDDGLELYDAAERIGNELMPIHA